LTTASLPILLASSSPRRKELLGRLGCDIVVVPAGIPEERAPSVPPAIHVLEVAGEKARKVARLHPGLPVLGADTAVVLGEELFGKPAGREDARRMLGRLSGRTHSVLTALTLCWQGREACHVEHATVSFRPIPHDLLEWYLATGEGDDKAGSYAVQGRAAVFIERVEGNVQAVVGLPLSPVPALLARVGLGLRPLGNRLAVVPAPPAP
jgi:nucleoside triphosphate pyrophosphatase